MSKIQKIIFYPSFFICLFFQVLPVIKSGLPISTGIGFWGPNGHDGVWHLSLINHINQPFSIDLPIMAGEKLKNYHPFFNIALSFITKATHIDSSFLLFQLFPIISASLFLLFSFWMGKNLFNSYQAGIILMILNCLNNSFGWIFTFFRYGHLDGESIFWAMQSPSNQLNPPFALSILILNLIFLLMITKSKTNHIGLIILLISVLPVIKVYSAIPAFIFLFFYLKQKKAPFYYLFIALFISLIIFLPFNYGAGSLLVFQPFWFTNSLFESPDRFYFPYLANLRYTLESTGQVGPRLVGYYIFSIILFLVGNFSFRLLSLPFSFKSKNWFFRPLIISAILLCLIPLVLIQSGTSWNTIQFLYYSLFLLNITLAGFLSTHFKLSVVVFICLLIPFSPILKNYLSPQPAAILSNHELEALNFLKNQPKGRVLTIPYDQYFKQNLSPPIPLYAYETTSYVAAYSFQPVFLADEMNLQNSGYQWQSRRDDSLKFFEQKNIHQDRGFLVNNQIDYLYLIKDQLTTPLVLDQLFLKPIFENSTVLIYQVER